MRARFDNPPRPDKGGRRREKVMKLLKNNMNSRMVPSETE